MTIRLHVSTSGKAIWKLDDPAALRAEQAERSAAVAAAARKKVESAIERVGREREKLVSIAALPSIQVRWMHMHEYRPWHCQSA
jgi:hypothetical protein